MKKYLMQIENEKCPKERGSMEDNTFCDKQKSCGECWLSIYKKDKAKGINRFQLKTKRGG